MLSLRQVSMLPLSRFGRPDGSPRYTLKPVAFRPKVPKRGSSAKSSRWGSDLLGRREAGTPNTNPDQSLPHRRLNCPERRGSRCRWERCPRRPSGHRRWRGPEREQGRDRSRHKTSLDENLAPVKASVNDLVAVDQALQKLEALDPRIGKLVELRFFGGLSFEETAEILDPSTRTVKRDWHKARAFLYHELARCGGV